MKRLCLLAVLAGCGGDATPDAAPRPDAHIPAGNIHLSWTVNGMSGADACAAVGASLVQVSWASTSGVEGDSDTFSCSSGMGTTKDADPGTYMVTVTLVGGNQDIAEAMAMQVTVEDGGTAEAGTVDFTASTQGGFRFTINAGATATNCGTEAENGAGVVGFIIELRQSGNCQQATVDVGGEQIDLDCTGTQIRCIERDEEVSLTGAVVGQYTLSIRGFEAGDQECYSKDSPFSIVGGDAVVNLGAITLPISTTNMMCMAP